MPSSSAYFTNLAKQIHAQHQTHLDKLVIVFPSTVVGHRFRQHFAPYLKQPVWSFQSTTFSGLMQQLHPCVLPDEMTLLTHMHQVMRELATLPEDFTTFIRVGRALLADMETIAQYRIDLEKCTISPNSSFVKLSVPFDRLYTAFHTRLAQHRLYYRGLHEQHILQELQKGDLRFPFPHLLFVGVHHFTPLGQELLTLLDQQCEVTCFFDVDAHYMDSSHQEAGRYLRHYAQHSVLGRHLQPPYPQKIATRNSLLQLRTSVTPLAQIPELVQLLVQLKREDPTFCLKESAVVLADDALLSPLYESMPREIPLTVQGTFPFAQTPLYALFVNILALYRALVTPSSQPVLLIKQMKLLAQHPYCKLPEPLVQALCRAVMTQVPCQKVNLVALPDLPPMWRSFLMGAPSLYHYLSHLLPQLSPPVKMTLWEQKSWEDGLQRCQRLLTFLADTSSLGVKSDGVDWLIQALRSLTFSVTAFQPEGLPVLLLRDTEGLDVRHLFLLSVYEGALPRTAEPRLSFLPSIKESDPLAPHVIQEAYQAYLFYRLLQRTQHLYFFSSSHHPGMGKPLTTSRYVEQLIREGHLSITAQTTLLPTNQIAPITITVKKDKKIQQALATFYDPAAKRALTPTALNTYLTCPLRFYFHYIARLDFPSHDPDKLSPTSIGVTLHRVLEALYVDYVGQVITSEVIQRLEKSVVPVTQAVIATQREQVEHALPVGAEAWWQTTVVTLVRQLLKLDIAAAPFNLLAVELGKKEPLMTTMEIGRENPVRLGGVIDRVDEVGGTIRIVDYKSGRTLLKVGRLAALFDAQHAPPNPAALQIVFYSWLYAQCHPEVTRLQPTLLGTREIFQRKPTTTLSFADAGVSNQPLHDIKPHLPVVTTALKQLLQALFDPKKPFVQTTDPAACTLCPYKTICQR